MNNIGLFAAIGILATSALVIWSVNVMPADAQGLLHPPVLTIGSTN